MNIYDFLAFAIPFGVFVLFQLRHEAMIKDVMNRFMAKNLQEYRYYEDKWKGDLKEVKTVQEENREERKEAKKEAVEEDDPDSLY